MFTGLRYESLVNYNSNSYWITVAMMSGFLMYVFIGYEYYSSPVQIYLRKNNKRFSKKRNGNGNDINLCDRTHQRNSSSIEGMTIETAHKKSILNFTKMNIFLLSVLSIICFLFLVFAAVLEKYGFEGSIYTELKNVFFAELDAVAVAIYWAIFESWKVLSEFHARRIQKHKLYKTDEELSESKKDFRCYINITASLIILFPPAVFVVWPFTSYGSSFLVFYLVFSIIVQIFWFSSNMSSENSKYYTIRKGRLKIMRYIFGLAVFAVIAHDKFCPDLINISYFNKSMSTSQDAFWLAGITTAIAFLGWLDVRPTSTKEFRSFGSSPLFNMEEEHDSIDYLLSQVFWLLIALFTLLLFSNLHAINWDGWRPNLSDRIKMSTEALCLITWLITLMLLVYKNKKEANLFREKRQNQQFK